ncbi:MAG: RHS repeat-associated core domain-containing protein [Deltaproteobacteria bacterium]|nr:RHS repeat-associated core domain-containing protein [Deltaproteobacteria bacterium]
MPKTACVQSPTAATGFIYQKKFTYDYRGFLAQVEEFENQVPKAKLRIVRNGLLAFQDRDKDNNIISQYTWSLGLLNLHRSGKDYSYLYDGKGNVSAVVDSTANIVASYQYSTFGRLLASTGSLDQPFGFSTKRYFAELGLVYYGYRYYNPAMAKWITRDPIGETGGVNLYAFALNNPVNEVGPLGLDDLLGQTRQVSSNPFPSLPSLSFPVWYCQFFCVKFFAVNLLKNGRLWATFPKGFDLQCNSIFKQIKAKRV